MEKQDEMERVEQSMHTISVDNYHPFSFVWLASFHFHYMHTLAFQEETNLPPVSHAFQSGSSGVASDQIRH